MHYKITILCGFYSILVSTYTLVTSTMTCRLCLLLPFKKKHLKNKFRRKSPCSAYKRFIKTSKYRCETWLLLHLSLLYCLAWRFRSSRSECFYEKGTVKILVKCTRKHLCWGLFFNKVAGQKSETSSNRDSDTSVLLWRLRYKYFPVSFKKFIRPFL